MTRVKTTTQCSIFKANVRNKSKKQKRKKKVCFRGCINNCERGFWNCGSGLYSTNGNSWSKAEVTPAPEAPPSPGWDNSRTGHCQIWQETECVPPQGVSGLNSLHSIKCMRAPLVSQLAFLWPKQLCICKWLSLLPTQFWCSPFSLAQCLLSFQCQLML